MNIKDLTDDQKEEIFRKLSDFPPEHEFWKNKYQFTRPVFTANSIMCKEKQIFWNWFSKGEDVCTGLRKFIINLIKE